MEHDVGEIVPRVILQCNLLNHLFYTDKNVEGGQSA